MCMFEQHQILVPVLIALEMQLEQGKVTVKEVECLGRNLGELDAQLDLAGDTNNRGELLSKPKWITDKVRRESMVSPSSILSHCCSLGAMLWNSRKRSQLYAGYLLKFLTSAMNGKNISK